MALWITGDCVLLVLDDYRWNLINGLGTQNLGTLLLLEDTRPRGL